MTDRNDIEYLFKSNYSRMHALASALLHDPEGAHDIVHDVFVSILNEQSEKLPDSAYLLVSVKNRCLNRLKALDVRERFRNLYIVENDESDYSEEWPDEETLLIIDQCKREMPPKCLEVFSMKYQQGLSAAEISQRLGTGERVIYKHLRHALNILKNRMNG